MYLHVDAVRMQITSTHVWRAVPGELFGPLGKPCLQIGVTVHRVIVGNMYGRNRASLRPDRQDISLFGCQMLARATIVLLMSFIAALQHVACESDTDHRRFRLRY